MLPFAMVGEPVTLICDGVGFRDGGLKPDFTVGYCGADGMGRLRFSMEGCTAGVLTEFSRMDNVSGVIGRLSGMVVEYVVALKRLPGSFEKPIFCKDNEICGSRYVAGLKGLLAAGGDSIRWGVPAALVWFDWVCRDRVMGLDTCEGGNELVRAETSSSLSLEARDNRPPRASCAAIRCSISTTLFSAADFDGDGEVTRSGSVVDEIAGPGEGVSLAIGCLVPVFKACRLRR